MRTSRRLAPVLRRLVGLTLASEAAVATALFGCGGAVLGEGELTERGNPTPSSTSTQEDRDSGAKTTASTDAGRDARDARTTVPVDAEPPRDAAVLDFTRCGDDGKRTPQNMCDWYERQVPCDVSRTEHSLTVSECQTFCGDPISYCYVGKSGDAGYRLSCGMCPGGRRPAGYTTPPYAGSGSAIGAYFATLADLEAASIDAFRILGQSLRAHGAPSALVRRAARATDDEVRHARMTAAIARRHGALGLPRAAGRTAAASAPPQTIEALATENAVEGCVRETFGAAVATWQGATAQDSHIAATMRAVARDETRHADLAWDVARWAATQLDAAARARVERAMEGAVVDLQREIAGGREPSLVADAGLPSAAAAAALFAGLRATLWARSYATAA